MAKQKAPRRAKKYWLSAPAGPSEIFSIGNTSHGTTAAITCEFCGRKFPELLENADSYRTFGLFSRTGLLECCGELADRLYREWGTCIFEKRMEEFRKDPLNSRFGFEQMLIGDAVRAWAKAAEVASTETREIADVLPSV